MLSEDSDLAQRYLVNFVYGVTVFCHWHRVYDNVFSGDAPGQLIASKH